MDRKSKRHWIEFIGLITAIVGCVTAFLVGRNVPPTATPSAAAMQETVDTHRLKLQAEVDAAAARDKAIAVAQEQAAACDHHQQNIAAIDARFGVLMQAHPILMNSLKSCSTQPDEASKDQCSLAVCALAQFMSGGGCPDIASDAFSIGTDFQREKKATVDDSCLLMRTSVQGFFES